MKKSPEHEDMGDLSGDHGIAPEFSRMVPIEEVTGGGIERVIEADEAERRALAERFDVLAVHALSAVVTLRPSEIGLEVAGRVTGTVEQSCVVTLEPVKTEVASDFAVRYISPHIEAAGQAGEELDPLGEDIEPLPADAIDIGELAAQYLSLAIDPYPRKSGAEVKHPMVLGEEQGASPRPNPFAVLKKLQGGA